MSRAATGSRPAKRNASRREPISPLAKAADGYIDGSEEPLTILLFLLPLVVLYELGTRWYTYDALNQTEERIIAFNWLQQFFGWFNASGRYLPALAIGGILLAWHVARGGPWKVEPAHLAGMILESVVLCLPLLLLSKALAYHIAAPSLAAIEGAASTKAMLVLSIGAGLYEELVFRLIGFSLFSFVLIDVLSLRKRWAYPLIVVPLAFMFSGYHYLSGEHYSLLSFAFRTAAGIYFGIVFICRGFGITAGSHAAYDVCVVLIPVLAQWRE